MKDEFTILSSGYRITSDGPIGRATEWQLWGATYTVCRRDGSELCRGVSWSEVHAAIDRDYCRACVPGRR